MWGVYISLIHIQFQTYFPEYPNLILVVLAAPKRIYQQERELTLWKQKF